MDIGGVGVVIGCECDMAAKYERFILTHAAQLAKYLHLHAEALRAEADEIDVPVKMEDGLQAAWW
jgi:hypothetical protein